MAVSPILGTILLRLGPGLSARTRCEERPVICGSSARVSTSTPMPPIQWVKLRQNITPRGSPSKLPINVAPVVVKPDTASKKASI